MTGNEHFIAAQSQLAESDKVADSYAREQDVILRRAQVHATLALVWAVNRMQTDAHGLQQFMAERILEHDEARP